MWRKNWKHYRIFALLLYVVFLICICAGVASAAEEQDSAEMVEIEYDGKILSVDMADLILMTDDAGAQRIDLYDPAKYEQQLRDAPRYGEGMLFAADGAMDMSDTAEMFERPPGIGANEQEIGKRQYDEEQRARIWADVVEDLTVRDIDRRALELVKEFGEAKSAVPPTTGSAGTVVVTYSSYTPKIVCRPMYVTDIMLQPGESVTGVHPGDPVRWQFVPSQSGTGDGVQVHVLVKPLMADISTNLIVNADRRTYQLELMSSATNFIPSLSFSYPDDTLKAWGAFLQENRRERESVLATGYSVDPEDLHLEYEIRGKDTLRWKPIRVWDDGVKTYIRFKPGSTKKSVEAPIFVVYEHKKQVLANYRATNDMYVVDRVFDKAALIVGTGAEQDRVVITRLKARGGKS